MRMIGQVGQVGQVGLDKTKDTRVIKTQTDKQQRNITEISELLHSCKHSLSNLALSHTVTLSLEACGISLADKMALRKRQWHFG